MKYIKFCFIILCIISLIKIARGQDLNNLCRIVRVQSEIWANEKLNDSIKFVRSELWSEYNDNVIKDRRVIPDTIWIISKLMLPVDWMGQELPKDSKFNLNLKLQLKFGDYDDCIDVINPRLTNEYQVSYKKLSYNDVETGMKKDGIFILKSNPIAIKKIMKENNIGYYDNNKQGKYLCQLIIRTYLGFNEKTKDCLIEHIQPICSPAAHDYIINEW